VSDPALAFVGDVHLDRDDPDLDDFLAFLERLGKRCGRIVLMGDLFNLWIGQQRLEQPHHRAVVDTLTAMRAAGVVVRYLEGNRDYRIGPCYAGTAVDDATLDGIEESCGGRRLFAVHGDLANRADRQYRTWRAVSRSRLLWGVFNLLPPGRRGRMAERAEQRMRATNLGFKREFPERMVRDYGSGFLAAGYDVVVLGHFHVEKRLVVTTPDVAGEIFVLPMWKDSRRHLEVSSSGEIEFVDSV